MNKKQIMEIATKLSCEASDIRMALSRWFYIDDMTGDIPIEERNQLEVKFYRKISNLEQIRLQLVAEMLRYPPEKENEQC